MKFLRIFLRISMSQLFILNKNGLTVGLIIKQETRIDIHGHRTIDPFHEVAQNEEALVQNKIERQFAPLQLLGNFTCSSSSAQLIF